MKQRYDQELIGMKLEKVRKLVREKTCCKKKIKNNKIQTRLININIESIFTESYSSCLEKLEHPPNQQSLWELFQEYLITVFE